MPARDLGIPRNVKHRVAHEVFVAMDRRLGRGQVDGRVVSDGLDEGAVAGAAVPSQGAGEELVHVTGVEEVRGRRTSRHRGVRAPDIPMWAAAEVGANRVERDVAEHLEEVRLSLDQRAVEAVL